MLLIMITGALGTFAQKDKMNKSKSSAIVSAKYTCPMHPDVSSDKPGKCSKCGMDLLLSKKEQMKMEVMKIYTCPMHAEVASKKPGKCPKCGMALVAKKAKDNKKSKTKNT